MLNTLPLSPVFMAFVFFIQLVFVSVYLSNKWRKSRLTLLHTYPQHRFPHLYVQTDATEIQRLTTRKRLDYLVLVIGLCILATLVFMQATAEDLGNYMIVIALLQVLPLWYSAYCCNNNAKLMAKQYPQKIRSTVLTPTTFSSIINVTNFAVLVMTSIVVLVFAIVVFVQQLWGDNSYKALLLMLLNLLVLGLITKMAYSLIYGNRVDHFIGQQERAEKLTAKLRYLIGSCTTYSVFLLIIFSFYSFNLELLWINVLASVCFQWIIFSTRHQYYPLDPRVYK